MAEETAVLDTPDLEIGDVEEIEQPSESTDITEEPEATEDEEPEVEGEQEEVESEEEEGKLETEVAADGRKMPDGLKKAIAGIKATSPEVAKQIKGLYWSDQEYRAAFPKPADAIAAKSLIEEIGGPEGIQEIAAEREEWQTIDRDFAEAKPEFVKSLAEGNPEAFTKLAPSVINEFAQRAPEQYQHYTNRLTLNTMANAGFSMQNLRGVYERYRESNPEAAGVVAEIYNSLHDLNQSAAQFEQKRTDPREEALKQRETQFETQRRADFEERVANDAGKFLADKMQPEIDRIIGARKVDPEALEKYKGMVKTEANRLLDAVPGIEAKLEAYYRTGDAKKSLEYVQSQFARLIPQAAKVIEPFLRNIPAAAQSSIKTPVRGSASSQQQRSDPGSVVLKEMPDWSQLDPEWRNSVNATAELMQGRAVLKSGKKASGWI